MNELVERLSRGDHPVEVSIRPEKSLAALKERIERGYVHVKFTDTRGGTELGFSLDKDASDLMAGNLETGTGTVRLVGDLTLNYVKVKAVAEINLQTLAGSGHLEPIVTP
jgi:hypothetical protein